MANVMFKRGTQAQLNTLKQGGSFVDGSFYLTTDTDRLYVAQSSSELVELNKSITTVTTVADLPDRDVEVGQFYYVTGPDTSGDIDSTHGGNILAVVTGFEAGTNKPIWVQVNPDTNTDHNDNDYVSNFVIEKDNTNSVAGSTLVYKWKISQSNVNGNDYADGATNGNSDVMNLTGSFTIAASDVANLAGAAVGVASTAASNNSTTISTTGAGAGSGSVTISGAAGGNVTVTGSANSIVLDSKNTEYQQSVDASNKVVSLENTDGVSNAIGSTTYADGTAINVTVAGSNSNKDATITVSHANVTRSDPSAVGPNTWAFGSSKTVVTGVTSNAQGHITAVATETLTMPTETVYAIDGVAAYSDGKIGVSLNGTEVKSSADLYYTVNGTPVYNQGTIDFYTKDQIDNKFDALDGMTYKGNIPSTGLPTSGVKNGDTYTVTADGTYGGQSAKTGDLLIASGTETDGVLPSNGITWNVIPSGDEHDTTYDLSVANNTISLTDNISGSTPDTVTIAGGNKLSASTSGTTITINHDTQTVTGGASSNAGNQNLVYGSTVNVVNGVKADEYGHVEAIYTSTLTMPSAPSDTKESFVVTSSTASSHGNGTIVLSEDNGGNDKGTITFGNGTLTTAVVTQGASSDVGTVVINHNNVTTTHTDNTSTSTIINTSTGFNAITAISTDGKGHVDGYTTSKFILPEDALVKLSGAADSNNGAVAQVTANTKAKVAFGTMVGANDYSYTGIRAPEFTLSTSSLKIVSTAATASTPGDIAIDIEWGSFT